MSLSSEEYLDHLQSTSVRAGFNFDEVALPDERHVALDGLRFRYLDWGTEGKRPILFLHGGALTAHTWDLCCLALRDEFHCMALDQRGHGDSDWAPDADYSLSAQREDVRGFADAIGLDDFVLVGMSMGAINALAYATHYPETLSALVLIDAGPNVRRPGSSRIRDFVNGGAEPASLDAIIERALAFNPRRDPLILRRSLMHNLRRQPDGNWTWKYDRRRFQQMGGDRHAAERRGLADGLAKISLSDPGRARRGKRRVPPGGRRAPGGGSARWPPRHDPKGRAHGAGRQPEGSGGGAAGVSRIRRARGAIARLTRRG